MEKKPLIQRDSLRRWPASFSAATEWYSANFWHGRPAPPPWRSLLKIYRRLEARGEIRGGQFVSGFIGEQFALPEAVEGLRAVRRGHPEQETVVISSADPLNLVGILTPGPRVSPYSNQAIAYRNGVPVEIGPLE